ncbi:Ankyrin-2 [Lucilia cuprina]|nr:Ankyrin-2 [Lucilia cuprina]
MLNPLKKRFPSLQSLGGDGNTSFLRAARAGNLDKVLEHLKNNIDINTSNANGLNALHLASKDGHIHVVSELLRRGAIVDSATKKGNTALHIASLAGQEEVVKMLLQHGASVNVQSQNGFTPLYMAAQENHDSVVKLLLSNGANQSLATEDGFTPLAVAMQQGHDKVVAVLLESDTRGKVRLPALHIAAKKDDVKAATLLLDNDHNPDVTSKSGFTPLHIASHYGNQAIANLLIQKGADVNFSAKHNISPLHVAAKWGKTNMVSLLLEKGANIEAKTRDGLTPLHCAARSGHEQVVDMLLERGAPISAKTKNGLAPLHMAAQGEHVDAARILLYHRAPVDEVTVDYLTALHVAAHCGHVRVAKLLLDRNADANARALNGFTPLHIACKKNRIKVVELLLRHGASISATTESGLTPLHVAAFMGCMNIVIYLLQHDASPDVPTVRGETPLHLAARANQTDIIRILLRNGAQVDARAREQQTPLHIASRLGNVDIVMLLLQHGAQVDATTKDMYTALHIAAKEGQDEVAAVLIENGAALDAATKKGFTPLHLTAKYGHIKVAQLLLQKEADVDAQGKNGVTPLHVACHYDNQNVALLLLEKGASPHATAKNGHTPLHIAARKNQMDIATTLLEYGAQANAESKAGFTPLHLSCQEGHSEISNLLIEHKAGVNHPAKNGLTPMHLCAQEDNVNVAEILQRNGANIDMATKAGYTPLHVAAHFGQANMVRFLLQHGANVDAATSIGYTPLHQSAQQGHCHIVKLLLEHNANANAQTTSGQTPLDIARKLGYISVLDSLKTITDEPEGSTQMHSDEKYRVVAPEAMHESFMSDSEEEGGEDNMLSDQPYRYLTVDEMKSLGDDSLPIDVTRDERVDSNRMAQSAEYGAGLQQQQPIAEEAISPHKVQTYNAAAGKSMVDGIYMANGLNEDDHQHVGRKLQWKSFLVSFLVDARGGAMRGCRHSGVRMIIPSRSTCQPTRVTCRYVKPQRTMHPPQLMEGEALASRVLELGPVSTKFIGPVIMEVPHFASLRGKEREIIILRSDNGETWREHTIDNSEEIIHDVLQQCFEPEEIAQLEEQAGNHVCRFVTYDFPQYFAVVTRIRQEVHAIGPEGGMVSSTVVPQVQAVFPQGALTKKIKVGLQAQPVDPDLTAKLLGRGVAVSPIVTVEPRRRKFHKAITLSMPAPKAHSQGMINQYSGNTPTLRLLCSITGGPSRAQWEDVTGSTPLTFVNDCVSFTTTVSARFWLMDCRNISEATKMATELYKEVIHVPFIAKFVVFAKKVEPFEARLRVFCMTDDREDKTLEKMELYTQVAKSRDVEVLEGKPQYIEMAGNLVPVTKSGEQLQLPFKAFRENRLPFTVRVKDQHADIVGRTLFMKEPKVAKGEPPQHPICILNIVLPEAVIPDSVTAFSDKITPTYRSSLLSFSKHQNDHYIGDIRIVDLSNLLGKDWIQLASEINISTEEVDEIINQNTDSIARQAQSMIRLYKDKPNYDIHSLEQALKNIGRDDIMNKCKSGRLSHSRDFDETDIMKNSESVEELVRQESKRIQQIHEREEIKYSAEEKEIEESESDEEIAKRTVAERRDKIVKRLSVERQIPASSQKKEITREITEIKRKSLIEDKKAIHESEIFMQLPADNSVKSAVVPEQVIKMKMGKIDATEVSKSDFDKELTHKFKSSSRSSEEEPDVEDTSSARQISHEEVDNLKIVKDITSVEKPSKIIDSLIGEKPSMESGSKQLTEDFLAFEKLTQLPSQILPTTTTDITEKFVEEVKEKSDERKIDDTIKETAVEVVTETVETASKKVESIISSFESSKPEKQDTLKGVQDFITAERKTFLDSAKTYTKEEESKLDEAIVETKESIISETVSVKDKIKAFTETKLDDISDKITSTKDSFKSFEESKTDAIKSEKTKLKEEILSETKSVSDAIKTFSETEVKELKSETAKLEQNVLQTKDSIATATEKTADTIVSFVDTKTNELQTETAALQSLIMDTKDTKISETINILQTTKDFISSETKNITEAFKSKIDEVKKETEETKEHAIDKKDSLVSETKSVAETIKAFNEPKIEDVKKEFGFSKESIVRDTKSLFDKSTEEFKEQLSETKETVISETQRVSETIKSFAEPKLEDIEKETSKAKAKVEFAKDSIDKQLKEQVHETKDTIITETKSVAETIKVFAEPKTDDIKKEASKIETKLEETKMSYEKSSEELKKHVFDMKDGIITETKSVTETIKAFTEPKLDDFKKETANLEKEITSTKDSIVKETKSLFDTKTDEFKQHVDLEKESIVQQTESYYDTKSEEIKEYVSDKKDSIITETKTVAETIKAFTEPKIDDIKKESSKIETKVGFARDFICEETKTQFDKKSDKVEHLISDSKDSIVEETMSVTETIKTFTEPKIEDIKKDTSKVETKVSEMMETIVTQTMESKTHDFKSGFEEMKDKLSDTEDFIITETKTVAETIKSFSEPKVTTSKIEEKFDDFIDSTKKESNKVSETIKSLSESFDKSSAEPKFEKVKIIPSDKIEDKIADFEAKKVTYEYHGLEPKLRVGLPTTTKAEDEKETIVSAPEAAPRKITTTTEESTFEESLEKLEEMKSIVADARKITKDFLSMEQQSQLPLQTKVEMKEESRLVEETIKTTITFPPIVEKTVTETVTKKVEGQVESKPETKTVSYDSVFKETIEPSVQETILDSRKLTHDFLSMEQKSQLPCEKQTADDISELSTETSQHSVEKSPIIETDSEKISLEHFEKADIDARKITHDFLSMEQKQQPFSPPKAKPLDELEQTKPSSIIDEVLIKATDIMTTISAGAEIPKDTKTSSKEDKIEKEDSKSILKSEQLIDDGIEKAAPIKDAQEMPSSVVKTLTQDFLTFEQSAPMFTTPKTSTDETKTSTDRPEDTLVSTTSDITDFTHQRVIKMTGDFLSMEQTAHKPQKDSSVKTTDELMAPIPIEPRKSLTDAEFCKSVQESITKKMSEGLIEISDELKIKESDIPHSQTPPPTPIETKIEKEEEDVIQQKPTMDEDNLIDTIKTLHKTTESTFERVSTISTIEMLEIHETPTSTTKIYHTKDTPSFTEMSESSRTKIPKITTTTTTIFPFTKSTQKVENENIPSGFDKKIAATTELTPSETAAVMSDRDYLEQIMKCGDVKRKIQELESQGLCPTDISKQSDSESESIDKNASVKTVVHAIEEKIIGSTVEAIPFAVRKRQGSHIECDLPQLEKQILNEVDVALTQLTTSEPPIDIVKLSPIEASEKEFSNLNAIDEVVCEKICQKKKTFEVAEEHKKLDRFGKDTNETDIMDDIVKYKEIDTITGEMPTNDNETLPKVREVVEVFEKKFPTSIVEAIPFSPRRREKQPTDLNTADVEKQILTETDLLIEKLAPTITEKKVQVPTINSPQQTTTPIEETCEVVCSQRRISELAKLFEIPSENVQNKTQEHDKASLDKIDSKHSDTIETEKTVNESQLPKLNLTSYQTSIIKPLEYKSTTLPLVIPKTIDNKPMFSISNEMWDNKKDLTTESHLLIGNEITAHAKEEIRKISTVDQHQAQASATNTFVAGLSLTKTSLEIFSITSEQPTTLVVDETKKVEQECKVGKDPSRFPLLASTNLSESSQNDTDVLMGKKADKITFPPLVQKLHTKIESPNDEHLQKIYENHKIISLLDKRKTNSIKNISGNLPFNNDEPQSSFPMSVQTKHHTEQNKFIQDIKTFPPDQIQSPDKALSEVDSEDELDLNGLKLKTCQQHIVSELSTKTDVLDKSKSTLDLKKSLIKLTSINDSDNEFKLIELEYPTDTYSKPSMPTQYSDLPESPDKSNKLKSPLDSITSLIKPKTGEDSEDEFELKRSKAIVSKPTMSPQVIELQESVDKSDEPKSPLDSKTSTIKPRTESLDKSDKPKSLLDSESSPIKSSTGEDHEEEIYLKKPTIIDSKPSEFSDFKPTTGEDFEKKHEIKKPTSIDSKTSIAPQYSDLPESLDKSEKPKSLLDSESPPIKSTTGEDPEDEIDIKKPTTIDSKPSMPPQFSELPESLDKSNKPKSPIDSKTSPVKHTSKDSDDLPEYLKPKPEEVASLGKSEKPKSHVDSELPIQSEVEDGLKLPLEEFLYKADRLKSSLDPKISTLAGVENIRNSPSDSNKSLELPNRALRPYSDDETEDEVDGNLPVWRSPEQSLDKFVSVLSRIASESDKSNGSKSISPSSVKPYSDDDSEDEICVEVRTRYSPKNRLSPLMGTSVSSSEVLPPSKVLNSPLKQYSDDESEDEILINNSNISRPIYRNNYHMDVKYISQKPTSPTILPKSPLKPYSDEESGDEMESDNIIKYSDRKSLNDVESSDVIISTSTTTKPVENYSLVYSTSPVDIYRPSSNTSKLPQKPYSGDVSVDDLEKTLTSLSPKHLKDISIETSVEVHKDFDATQISIKDNEPISSPTLSNTVDNVFESVKFSNTDKTNSRAVAYFVDLDEGDISKPHHSRPNIHKKQNYDKKLKTSKPKLDMKSSVKPREVPITSNKTYSKRTSISETSPKIQKSTTQTSSREKKTTQRISQRNNMESSVTILKPRKDVKKIVVKDYERIISDKTKISALNNQIRLERTLSPQTNQSFSENVESTSRSTTPRPRIRTDITRVPQQQTLRTFSPPPNRPKPDYSSITSTYAYTRKTQKTAKSVVRKQTDHSPSSRSSTPNDDSQRRRLRTPTVPIGEHHYMQPTIAHSRRYGNLKSADSELSLDEKFSKSPVPQVTAITNKNTFQSKQTKPQSGTRKMQTNKINSNSRESLKSSETKTKISIERMKSTTDTKQKSTTKRIRNLYTKDNSLKSTIDKSNSLTKSAIIEQVSNVRNNRQVSKEKAVDKKKIVSKSTAKKEDSKLSSEDTNRLKDRDVSATNQKQITNASSKVPIRTKTNRVTDDKVNKLELKAKVDQKQSTVKRNITKKIDTPKDKLVQSKSIDLKVQKKLKNTLNNQAGSTPKSSPTMSHSSRKSTSTSATTTTSKNSQSTNKIEKELLNSKLAERKSFTTTVTSSGTNRISTVKLHREPIATTIVSTVVITDDNDSENNTRSVRSNDSTKSSSSSGSRKVITSEVFTKTFGPDKPFEVIYRQPEVDYMSIMRPQSVEQRCVNEYDVSFIDTTDSSLSDSVALPTFTSDQDRLCAASPGSPKPTRSPFALIEETIRKQQASGFALDPTLQRQFEAVGMIGSESESPMTSSIVNDNDLHKQETLQTYIPEPQPIVSVEAIATQETKSTDITPVPPSAITTTLSQQSHDNADLGAPQGDVPKPKPRSVRISTPTEDVEEEKMSSQMPYEVEEQEVSFDLSDDVDNSVVPVPKPRSQMKTSDSFKNLDTLNQQQHHQPSQSDSISLRSFDYTEETSRTDDPSVSVSISMKSQQLDYPLTTTNTTTTTTSEDPATESIDPPSELSIDDGNVETERKTSFYIGESSRNIITKTTPTKLSVSEGAADEPLTAVMCREPIEATDISLMKEFSVDSDEENDVFKEYVTIKPTEPEAGTRIRRQSSETRNDLLEEDALTKETIESTTVVNTMTTTTTTAGAVAEDGTLRKTSTEQSFTTTTITSTTSTSSAPLEVIHSTGEDDSVREISESMDIEIERPIDLDLPLEKSEWETTEKEIPPTGKGKILHSPQQPILSDLTKEALTEEMVAKTLEEVQESLDAAKNELKSVLKDGKSIKESPSEFEFRSFSQTIASGSSEGEKISDMGIKTEKIIEETVELMEDEDISSFIGVPENIQDKHSQETENVITSTVIESLNREAAMLHYAQNIFEEKKPETSLGFVSTGTAESQDSHTSSDDHIVKEERASLGFISSETAEDFSSMEDYYQEKLAKADIVTEAKEKKEEVITSTTAGVDTFGEISSELTMKPFEDVVHRIKTESADNAQNRWSVPEIDQSSSSESYYKSFEKSESRPLSSDIENLMTQANSSEYQTAADVSSVYRETTEFVSAVSTFESSSGKTISSHESMRSLDSQSETSANLGSIDVSELSETLVASSTEEAEELQRLRDLADEEDSDDSLDLEIMDYTVSESKIQQQSQMKRSQEMIFKPKSDDVSRKTEGEEDDQEKCIQTVQIEEYAKPKEVEKTWGLTYPIEDTKTDDFKDTDDILLYHGDIRRSIDDTKYASSLDEGSILSVSMSSTSNIDTVVENFEDIVGSVGASSLAGIEGFAASSLPEETTFVMEMDEGSGDFSPQNSTATTPPGETPTKRGHKRSESTSVSGDDIKNTPDKDTSAPQGEGKESESESDTDPYETEYARQFRSPSDRKSKKKKQAAAEMDHSFETEKRPFTPSQLVAEVIVEDSLTEELEAEECLLEERRPSQNMLNYSNIPDITVTEDIQPKSPILEEDTFEEKTLYKVKTQEELHKATDDRPLHEEKEMVIDLKEENFQKLVQEQYKQKLAELQKAEIGDSDYDYNKAPDSPDSFEMVDQPDISDEFVIIEEVAKEANEDDLGGKSIRIAPTKYESKHDEEVEKIIIKSAPADPKLGSQIFRDDLNFEFEESPPTGSSGGAGSEVQDESDSGPDMAANNKRWVEMQLTDNQLRYPYDLTGGVLEDIKEEDGEFEVGSSRISSFKDSFSSTPEYDVMAARRYYAARGEHDDISMSSLQEFESLEQAISLENRNRTHQGSTDSSNGSFQRRYILRNSASGPAQGDDISISSLKEFEGLENACIEAHLIEIKAKEEAAMLSRSDESNKSNGSDRDQILDPTKVVVSKVIRTVTHTEVLQSGQQPPDIETLLKQKLQECERAQSSIQITEISRTKADSDKGSIDSLEMNRSVDMVTSSVDDSFDISKDGTTKSDIDSLEVDKRQPTREESIESIEMEQMDDVMSKFGVTLGDGLTTTTTTTTTSTDADGHEHTTVTTRIITKATLTGGGASSTSLDASAPEMMTKDFSAESLNQMSALDQTTTSSAGTTATYQTSAGNSQMSGSITSCASSTLMEDSAMSMSGLTMSSSYWSHEEETVKEGTDVKTKDTLNKEDHPPH